MTTRLLTGLALSAALRTAAPAPLPQLLGTTLFDTGTVPAIGRRGPVVEHRQQRTQDDSIARARRAPVLRPRPPLGPVTTGAMDMATMMQPVHFMRDRAELGDTARRLLDEKLSVFAANPAMKIVIVGHASAPGTVTHNMSLGLRRAEAARDYLVQHGVAFTRIEIATRGANELLVEGPGDAANAANRRGVFRIQIAELPPLSRP